MGKISRNSINYLVNNLTPNISKLSLSNSPVTDEDVATLVSRCNKLTMLYLNGNLLTNNSITSIIDHLKPTLEILDLSSDNISLTKLFELKSMPNLKALICEFSDNDMEILKENIPHVKIGEFGEMIDYWIPSNNM